MSVESQISVVDTSNLSAADIETAVRAEVDVLEAGGFVVTAQDVQPPLIYLLGLLPTHLGGAAGVETSESLWIPANDICVIGGTWTYILDSNGVPMLSRAQADATGTVTVPIVLPGAQATAARGFQLESVALSYAIVTAAADAVGELGIQAFTPVLTAVATDGDPILSAVATTIDTEHDTAGERLTIGEHNTIATVDVPAYGGDGVQYQADMTFDAAATTDLDIYGVLVRYSATR